MTETASEPRESAGQGQSITLGGREVLSGVPDSVTRLEDRSGVGLFLEFRADEPAARHVFDVGTIPQFARFTACARYEPFWMRSSAGTRAGEVPLETQSLIVERTDGSVALIIPLSDGPFRAAVHGSDRGDRIQLVAESGDPAVVTDRVVGLFVAAGEDVYELIERSARSVMRRLGTGRLRTDKPVPRFADLFGWCTWDAFYQDVSHDKVRAGLNSFADGGVRPKLLILDDGWQSVRKAPAGNTQLCAFAANEKFPGDLRPTVEMAKGEFGVERFLVWHAMMGYWGGADPDALPGYGIRPTERRSSPDIQQTARGVDEWWGRIIGLVSPEHVHRFFHDYHRHLRAQGVDGVKVDTQAALETVAHGSGGRVALMRAYHEALEGSAQVHFAGDLINCMSCANEMLYGAPASNVTRTSTDFWPKKPESHGLHLYVNAQVSAWFGQFVHPDWDMFQSGHPMGAYHAAGRAVSGSPVYVSDKPDAHDFDLLRKLVLPDGTTLRCAGPGLPTRDCLFRDPTREDVLLKIFNHNDGAGVIGAFNARYAGEGETPRAIHGTISPTDIPALAGERFAVYAHNARSLFSLSCKETHEVTLDQLAAEVFTVVPIDHGVAVIGLPDMFNSAGAVAGKGWAKDGTYAFTLRAGGRALVWAEVKPKQVSVDGRSVTFSYDEATKAMEVRTDSDGPCEVSLTM